MALRITDGKRQHEDKVTPDSVPEPENDTDTMEVVDAALLQIKEEEEQQVTLSLSDDIQPPTRKEDLQNQKLLMDIKTLEEKVASLEEERDFLREMMKRMSSAGKTKPKKRRHTSSSSDISDSGSSLQCSFSSDCEGEEKIRNEKKKQKKDSHPLSKLRAHTPDDVLQRYKRVLKYYQKHQRMSKAFQEVGIDRNTVALSAPLAEIMLVDEDFLKTIPPFEVGKEKLLCYVRRCTSLVSAETKSKIDHAKKIGKLLPITPKFLS